LDFGLSQTAREKGIQIVEIRGIRVEKNLLDK
jgi:hypothetical protein